MHTLISSGPPSLLGFLAASNGMFHLQSADAGSTHPLEIHSFTRAVTRSCNASTIGYCLVHIGSASLVSIVSSALGNLQMLETGIAWLASITVFQASAMPPSSMPSGSADFFNSIFFFSSLPPLHGCWPLVLPSAR